MTHNFSCIRLHYYIMGKQLYSLLYDDSLCKLWCNVWAKHKIETEISHPQSTATQTYKRTCTTVLKVLSHNAIKVFVLYAF